MDYDKAAPHSNRTAQGWTIANNLLTIAHKLLTIGNSLLKIENNLLRIEGGWGWFLFVSIDGWVKEAVEVDAALLSAADDSALLLTIWRSRQRSKGG
jgi:hypothetical protein